MYRDMTDENKATDKFTDYADIALVDSRTANPEGNVDLDEAVNTTDSSTSEGNTQETYLE